MQVERQSIAVTCAADGSATSYSTNVTGRILGLHYVKTNFSNGVDHVVTLEATGEAIVTFTNLNASASFYPRVQVHDETGAGATLDGVRLMREPVYAANDRVKIVTSSGGNATTGAFILVVG